MDLEDCDSIRLKGTCRMEVRASRRRSRPGDPTEATEVVQKYPRVGEESAAKIRSTAPTQAKLIDADLTADALETGQRTPVAAASDAMSSEAFCPLQTVETALGNTHHGPDLCITSELVVVGSEDEGSEHASSSLIQALSLINGEPKVPDQILRISAGRVATAAGVHPYADESDIGDMFLELLYQDMPEVLVQDALLVGAEVVSPAAERAKLLAKSGETQMLESILKEAASAPGVEGAQVAREAIARTVAAAERTSRLTSKEAGELRTTLEREVNLEFGARHEDAALEAYEARTGMRVYGQQKRISVALPSEGPEQALLNVFPRAAYGGKQTGNSEPSSDVTTVSEKTADAPFFRLTGYIDGLVDVPLIGATVHDNMRGSAVQDPGKLPCGTGSQPESGQQVTPAAETVVVEVKHRMNRIKDPPEIYDVIQLCSYCRALGCTHGDLVQCLRDGTSAPEGNSVGTLHITRLDFSEGSLDRRGWDTHVLPNLYAIAEAVYLARQDQMMRCRLLAAEDPAERARLIEQLCPHLGR